MKGIFKFLVFSLFSFCFVQNSFTDNSFTVFLEQNKHLDELDYYKSSEVVINFYGKQLSFNWGGVGHGDILQPFYGIKPEIRDIEVISSNDGEDKLDALTVGKKIAKVIFKQQAKKLIGENLNDFLEKLPPFARWIVEKVVENGKLSPVEEFVLRSYILYKTPFNSDKQALKKAEFTALLFKLALTEDQDVFDIKNGLGSYLVNSEMIKELLGQDFVTFSSDILSSLQNGFQDCDFDNLEIIASQTVPVLSANYKVGYIFRDLGSAEQCYALFGNREYSEKEFKVIVDGFIQSLRVDVQDIWSPKNYETISVDRFKEYENSTLKNFIGLVSNADQILEFIPVVESVVAEQDSSLNVQLIQGNNEFWVVLKSMDKGSNLDLYKTVKFTIAAIYKTFEDYNVIKNSRVSSITNRLSSKLDNEVELREFKQKLENLLNTKIYLKKELITLDLEIEKTKAKLGSSSNLWNKFFSNDNKKELQDFLEKREKKEKQFLNIKTEIKKLRVGLYYLTAPERLQNLSDKGFFAITTDMFLSNPRVQEFVRDINKNSEYKSVKENLIKRLAKIFGQSDYVKEYWEVAEYILSNLLPNYKNDFRNFAQNLNEQDDVGDLILSFIGL